MLMNQLFTFIFYNLLNKTIIKYEEGKNQNLQGYF